MSEAYTIRDHELREIDVYARTKYEITIDWLEAGSARTPLANVGCGSGIFNEMAVDAGFVVAGYEPDPAAYQLALKHRPPHNCTVEAIGLQDIPAERATPVVVMHDVLEHIEDEQDAVEHLRSIVTDDGRVVVSVPAMPSLFGLHDEELGHVRRYTRRSLRRALEPSFEITRLRAFGFTFIPLTFYYSRWRRRPYPLERAAGGGPAALLARRACALERRVPFPMGTSLICMARPRPAPR
jgi:2-polyprenyl-3-methyl-5-hydroxy-6-metoxy-1,4-benzoquinol methylase